MDEVPLRPWERKLLEPTHELMIRGILTHGGPFGDTMFELYLCKQCAFVTSGSSKIVVIKYQFLSNPTHFGILGEVAVEVLSQRQFVEKMETWDESWRTEKDTVFTEVDERRTTTRSPGELESIAFLLPMTSVVCAIETTNHKKLNVHPEVHIYMVRHLKTMLILAHNKARDNGLRL